MIEEFRELIAKQYAASLGTLHLCIERCPDELWNTPVGRHPICRVAFHTLFFTDYYLGPNEEALRMQPFHRQRPEFFGDYEELQHREPVGLYERTPVEEYMQHCREKAEEVTAAETEETLLGPSGFPRRKFTRAELHVYSIRHIQHHAVQLSLRLRLSAGEDVPWVGSGWPETPS